MERVPDELLSLILLRVDVGSFASVVRVDRRWQKIGLEAIGKRLQGSSVELRIMQESHWSMFATLSYTGFDTTYSQATYQVRGGSGIRLYRFFYALLVSRPQTFQVNLGLNHNPTTLTVPLTMPIRLETKATGIKVAAPLDAHCSFLYTVENNKDLGIQDHHRDAPGVRWVTPLSFHCSLDFFSRATPIHTVKHCSFPIKRITRAALQTLWPSRSIVPTPSMLHPRISQAPKQKQPHPRPPVVTT
ncbi:hypothetical protein DSO57_1006059 [Entomophthora muscae]|uniref:Uncharacterized protein n=2 Tax=Entomophthora muscae TaxID=34485 RepID=A0ACC2SGX1_9FUNG|nr:hypothetical protein DSO57_1019036 [Entomophthora muscae]KAJ9082274.1 hypothetical protein DSO57_1006059 [Entomophthora muscae]